MARRGCAHHDKVCELVGVFAKQDVIRVVEIGIASGNLSKRLLTEFPQLHLTMIDHWLVLLDGHRDATGHYNELDKVIAGRERAIAQTDFAGDRRRIYEMTSNEAAKLLAGQLFDLVFIDGGHSTVTVAADIRNYWPLVRGGGILSGHDYRKCRGHRSVTFAVDAWVAENGKQLHVHDWWVWHVEKD